MLETGSLENPPALPYEDKKDADAEQHDIEEEEEEVDA
jgi:hypothetical protein